MTASRTRHGVVAEAGGRVAETAACAALEADGFHILRRRARTEAGEIDLVARRGGLVVFVEVKQRTTLAEAAYALSPRQAARLRGAAAILLAENPDWQPVDLRFDMLLIDRTGQMRRITDVVRDGDATH